MKSIFDALQHDRISLVHEILSFVASPFFIQNRGQINKETTNVA